MNRLVPVIIAIALTACAKPPVEYRPVPLHLIPERPQLPTIKSDELKCIGDMTYINLVERDTMLREHVDELRALLGAQTERNGD